MEISHSWGSVAEGEKALELPALTSVTVLPRVGFYAPLSDRLGIWPRVAIGYASVESHATTARSSEVVRESMRAMLLELEVAVVMRMSETFFLRAGPELGATLGGRQAVEGAASASASMVSVSATIGLGANVEL